MILSPHLRLPGALMQGAQDPFGRERQIVERSRQRHDHGRAEPKR